MNSVVRNNSNKKYILQTNFTFSCRIHLFQTKCKENLSKKDFPFPWTENHVITAKDNIGK